MVDLGDLDSIRVIDLAQPLERGIPVSPNHPGFEMALIRRHGDMTRPDGGSAANEIIVMGGHVGTHIDALAHVSQDGQLHGGIDASSVVSNQCFDKWGVDEIEPILTRGVLLDIVEVRGRPLEAGEEVTVSDLKSAQDAAGVELRPNDAVLLRTGWARHWSDPPIYLGQGAGAPGPAEAAARWLADWSPKLVGGETVAFERIAPGEGHRTLPVHRVMLVENGIYIVENMNLSRLADAGVGEFVFQLSPLPLLGATGSPCRPVAFLER